MHIDKNGIAWGEKMNINLDDHSLYQRVKSDLDCFGITWRTFPALEVLDDDFVVEAKKYAPKEGEQGQGV